MKLVQVICCFFFLLADAGRPLQQQPPQRAPRTSYEGDNKEVESNQDAPSFAKQNDALKQNAASVGLFKNGYAFHVLQYQAAGDGTYTLDLPDTVHGTLAVSSPQAGVNVTTQVERVNVPVPLDAASLSRSKLQTTFAGKQVVLQLKDSSVSGTLIRLAESEDSPRSTSAYSYSSASTPDFLVVQDDRGGLTMVDPSEVLAFKVQGDGSSVTKQKDRATVTLNGAKGSASPVQVSYLSYGMTWAPSYYINISDPRKLDISFQAQIRTQDTPLQANDVQLITGFPNLQFQSVDALLSSELDSFIRQVNDGGSSSSYSRGNIMSQSIMSNSAYGMSSNVQSTPVNSDGSDVLYLPFGSVNLKPRSALMKTVSEASGPYLQVVDWDASDDDAWDAVRFLNPLSWPLTTAPASIVQNNRLLGQSSTSWTPPQGLAIVHTSKALSVRVWKSETEGEPVPLTTAKPADTNSMNAMNAPAGMRQDKLSYEPTIRPKLARVTVEGVLNVVNTRSKEITMCVNYGFDGKPVPGRLGPSSKVETTEGGSSGLNPRTNVNWEFVLPAGELRNVTFYYTYLKRVY